MKLQRILFYLTVLLLPTQLGYHFWPDWAMVLGRKVDYLSPTLYLTDILILCLLTVWILSFVINRIINTHQDFRKILINRFKQLSFPHYVLIGLWIIFIYFNIVFAGNFQVAVMAWLKGAELTLFGFYIYKTRPGVGMVSFILSLSVIYSSVIAVSQFFLQHTLGGMFWLLGERTFYAGTPGIARINFCSASGLSCRMLLRAYGTFPHPNVLGGFLAASILLILYFLTKSRKTDIPELFPLKQYPVSDGVKTIYIISAVSGITALYFSFSRTAWAALGIGILLLGLLSISYRYIYKTRKSGFGSAFGRWGTFVVIGLFLLAIPSSIFSLESLSSVIPGDESVVVRNQLNQAALSMVRVSPFFGVGAGNYLIKLPEFLVDRQIYFLQPVHNIYLLVYTEFGIIGTTLLVISIYFVVKHHSGKMRIYSDRAPIRISLCALLFIGLFDHYPLTLQQGQLFLTLLFFLSI
jgi:hypothetical protein